MPPSSTSPSSTSDTNAVPPNDTAGPNRRRSVDPKLLDLLVCPLTKAPLRYDAAAQELISDKAALAYPIRDGIPILLVDEARSLDQA
jgi:uncharacterized protein YbaR (Trm112 family)